MQEQGADNETIRQETGWFRGMDGKWRYDTVVLEVEEKAHLVQLKTRTKAILSLAQMSFPILK